jgi:hypothetical protein
MNRWSSLDRKSLVTTLGTAGLGLGLIVAMAGGPSASAQEVSPTLAQDESEAGEGEVRERPRWDELREQFYAEFTAALADELGIGNSDEVDAAIRVAMMTVVDARADDGLLTAGQAEALKTLIATSDVPLGPGSTFAPPPGAFIRGGHGFGEDGRFFPIRGGDQKWITQADDGAPADDEGDRDDQADEEANEDNSQANDEDASS